MAGRMHVDIFRNKLLGYPVVNVWLEDTFLNTLTTSIFMHPEIRLKLDPKMHWDIVPINVNFI